MTRDPTIPEPGDRALFLDFDGTLVEIAPSPDSIVVDPGLAGRLSALAASLGGALAVVSGRPVSQLDHYLGSADFAAAGLHGLELRPRPGADLIRIVGGVSLEPVRARLVGFAAEQPGLLLEDKGRTLALHYRARPDLADACRRAVQAAVAGDGRLKVLDGKMVVEVKPAHADKGSAVVRLMQAPPFRGRRPVFVGDDTTDEDGFAAAEALGGFGVKVGPGETRARYRLSSVSDVLDWLAAQAAALAGEAGGR